VIAFVCIAAVMVMAALAWILVPLLRGAGSTGVAREASNVAILRDQLAELEIDLGNGTIPREQYEQARRELEQRVLEESKAGPGGASGSLSSAGALTAAILAGALPIAAILIYVVLGNFAAFAPTAAQSMAQAGAPGGAPHELTKEELAKMATELSTRLQKEPGDAEGWVMLARTYYMLNRHPEAARAFERAVALLPQDASLLADYADALGAAQGGTLEGKPMQLVEQALKADPTQWKALALAGTFAFDHKDYAKAVGYWERMKATVPADSPVAKSIDSSIAEARELGGVPVDALAPLAPVAKAPAATPQAPAAKAAAAPSPGPVGSSAGVKVAGTVKLAPALASKASPDDVVFVFARAAQGPKMPLAILRKQVRDLPITFTLDDTMAMAPGMALSNFPDVVVGARVSKSGQAMPQSGDLEGISPPVKVGASGIAIVIEKMIP
jgi:cytochrome c-type biogenesis protein CcmH